MRTKPQFDQSLPPPAGFGIQHNPFSESSRFPSPRWQMFTGNVKHHTPVEPKSNEEELSGNPEET